MFLTVIGQEAPNVPENERMKVSELAPTVYRVVASYGFSDTPDIPALLKRCSQEKLGFKYESPTFFLGRETLMAAPKKPGEMWYWRKKVFNVLAKNAMVAAHFFKLPIEDVIEVGMEVEF